MQLRIPPTASSSVMFPSDIPSESLGHKESTCSPPLQTAPTQATPILCSKPAGTNFAVRSSTACPFLAKIPTPPEPLAAAVLCAMLNVGFHPAALAAKVAPASRSSVMILDSCAATTSAEDLASTQSNRVSQLFALAVSTAKSPLAFQQSSAINVDIAISPKNGPSRLALISLVGNCFLPPSGCLALRARFTFRGAVGKHPGGGMQLPASAALHSCCARAPGGGTASSRHRIVTFLPVASPSSL